MQQDNWEDLKLFLALIRAGNMRDAAATCGVSYSTISRRIDALTSRSPVALFEPEKGRYHLTAAGEDFFRTAEEIEERLFALSRRAFGQDQVLRGHVSISILDALATSPYMAVLQEFADTYPEITLDIRVGNTLADLDRGQADLALRFGAAPQGHLIGRRLTETARAVYASHAYAEQIEKGNDAKWICFTPKETAAVWKKTTPFPDALDAVYMSHMPAQLTACKLGVGLCYLPCFLADNEPGLRRLSDPDCPPFQTLWLLRHPETRNNARLRALADFIANRTKSYADLLSGKARKTEAI
ncbi:LysR family transcriptional regulator [Cognatishimia activa]|uniref:D-malate degradation protein R n=1 Tax=Cognatishimia activa TaxID=1715691 RepID=A0A0N7MBS5_9RHOB|nr:LysR family transcriptional regulator [Cognatishimia activa]MEE2943833.1 LysR family transcriptional regulator [Pseudomonadota bacterium]CUI99759.1 D-malate degradation protein R [Cognatishimia activa]CUK26224.1 D-malate degradation protein R [Cognatishimia activa]